jgi:membrane peptidoglycan carboxypeptidase
MIAAGFWIARLSLYHGGKNTAAMTPRPFFLRAPVIWTFSLLAIAALVGFLVWEFSTSTLQSKYLTRHAARMTYQLGNGPTKAIRFPGTGPADLRMGYARLPDFIARAREQGFSVSQQARISPSMLAMADRGLFLPFDEKTQAGLTVLDCSNQPVFSTRTPQRGYKRFADVPRPMADTLLFIENRDLLDKSLPNRNPAVEWDRLAQAVLDKITQMFYPAHDVPGGSTLATQIEKYRHSPDGLTMSASDKLGQMASASVRAYLHGENTLEARREIVLDYLNTVPMSAAPRFGEVNGVPDALWAWFGLDYQDVATKLRRMHPDRATASAYKHVLALLISQRRPSYYLAANKKALLDHTNVYLKLVSEAGIISPAVRDLALPLPLNPPPAKPVAAASGFARQKAANAIRVRIGGLLGVPRMYDVDRLDLTAVSTLAGDVQQAVVVFLQGLSDPENARAAGLFGSYLFTPEDDLSKPIYSFTLYELTPQGALLRVQADNLDQPFDINQGTKLDLGSTAKLRTLTTYLNVIANLHGELSALAEADLRKLAADPHDPLAQWTAQRLLSDTDTGLKATLHAAMDRRYSADPHAWFFTGGGQHRFANFNPDDDKKTMDVWEATRNSVNLVYIRLMRDVVRHYMSRAPGAAGQVLRDASNPGRQTYLLRFAEKEGRAYLWRFYKKYQGQDPERMVETLFAHTGLHLKRLAATYRFLEPDADLDSFKVFLKSRLPSARSVGDKALEAMYLRYDPAKFNLADQGYITQLHPLELWLVRYLRHHPDADFAQAAEDSAEERIAVYNWLFKTGRKNAQDIRIQSLIEVEAFEAIHREWKRLGYPFDGLVPSLATSIGSSADRPAALAELMGILLNDGIKLPTVSLKELRFAEGTPYETRLLREAPKGERLLPGEVAAVVREAITQVVEQGTARRVAGALKLEDGTPVAIGGKTGTGDHRFERYDSRGNLLESRVMNRSATFVFFLGPRHFGTLTVFVAGSEAGKFQFTSSLPAQLLKTLAPLLMPLITGQSNAPAV